MAGLDIDGLLVKKPDVWPVSEGYAAGLYRNTEPEQLPELTEVMVRAGYSDHAVRAVLGENFLGVARSAWK